MRARNPEKVQRLMSHTPWNCLSVLSMNIYENYILHQLWVLFLGRNYSTIRYPLKKYITKFLNLYSPTTYWERLPSCLHPRPWKHSSSPSTWLAGQIETFILGFTFISSLSHMWGGAQFEYFILKEEHLFLQQVDERIKKKNLNLVKMEVEWFTSMSRQSQIYLGTVTGVCGTWDASLRMASSWRRLISGVPGQLPPPRVPWVGCGWERGNPSPSGRRTTQPAACLPSSHNYFTLLLHSLLKIFNRTITGFVLDTVIKDCLRLGEAWGLSEAICLIRVPWQLSATMREMMAVLPNPILPTTATPRLVLPLGWLRWPSISWKSHSRPVKTESMVMLGTSNSRGLRAMSWGR